jgi:hypothetical protein
MLPGVAGVQQLSQEDFIQLGLLAPGLFGLELAQRVLTEGAHGFSLSPGEQIGGAKLGGVLLLVLLPSLAAGDRILCLAQNGFDKLQFGGGKVVFGRAYSGGFPAPLRGFGKTVLKSVNAHHGLVETLARLPFEQAPDAKKSFKREVKLHHSSIVSSAEMVRSICGISKVP